MTYQALPIETHTLDELALDLDNYRIPVRSADENSALNYLYAEEDVFETAKMIIRDGYFDNEVPIVVEDGKRYTVLEGNRRVSALKVLADPSLIPDHEDVIRGLLKRYATEAADLPTAIRVLVAPTRDAAARHIARLHTTVPKKRWSRDQQAKYYFSLLGSTTTVEDVRRAYPGVSVPRFIKMAVMRQFLGGVKFTDRTLHEYVTGERLTMSAFEYAYKKAAIAAAIGASFNRDGLLLPVAKSPERIGADLEGQQLAAVEYLMAEFRAGRLNTRSPEFGKDTPELARLLAALTGVAPEAEPQDPDDPDGDPEDPGSEDPWVDDPDDGPDGGSADPKGDPGSGDPRGPNHPDTKDRLILTGLDFTTHASVNLQNRYHELQRLALSRTPVAAAMLMRAVLESTIKFHFEGTATPAHGQLKDCITVVKTAYGKEKEVREAINKIDSADARTPGTVRWFNDVTHSADAVPTPQTVRDALRLLHPLLRLLLRPAQPLGS
ncbi:hypothetical protein LL946_10315 [Knoellia locipacati]|uniref:hypothetical protein n=1 Tax=Knoellia locipacati TaxID=882824 RepID=UPI0038511EE7